MSNIIVYSTTMCPFCVMAKRSLKEKGFEYTEINIGSSADLRAEMLKKSGGKKTVPQIFINDHHVGGYDDLKEAERNGQLDQILSDEKLV